MKTTYFFPINSASLAHYFGCACVKPSKYFENKPIDIQNRFDAYLLLNKNNVSTNGVDCSLELVFTEDEIKELKNINNGFYLYPKPLPISRVKAVYFITDSQKEQTITNIEISTAFIPDELINISSFDDIDSSILEKATLPNGSSDWINNIKQFDSLLGGLALMRLAREEYMNYSENYFSTLSFFNEFIQQELKRNKIGISDKYFDAFIGERGFKKLLSVLTKRIEEQDLNTLAEEEGQKISKNNIRLIDLSNLDKNTYIAAVLFTYKVGQEAGNKKVDELIRTNFKEVQKGEGIALCYGLNRGYSVFNNKYKDKIVKFQLNSQLDYYTIESLYQYAFNARKSNKFPYLDSWCPKYKANIEPNKMNYPILDVRVIGKKKPSPEWWTNLLPFFQNDKFFEKPLSQLFKEFGEVVHKDTKEELEEYFENQIALKNKDIEKLKAEQMNLLQTIKDYKQQEENPIQTVAEQRSSCLSKYEVKKIAEQVLKYKEKTKPMLEEEAKEKQIQIPTKSTINDIILLLVAPPDTSNDTKLFAE
jgi:hypothetical protein